MNQLAISNPVLLQDLKPDFGQIVRQFPDAQHSFLRFQVGVNVKRPMIEARFEGNSFIGEFPNGRSISVFKLLGFGETFEAAQRMASKNSKASPILSASSPELLESLQHMRVCAACAQGSWEECDGGMKALAVIAKATGGQS